MHFPRCTSFLRQKFDTLFPGIAICLVIAAAANFLASHYGAPQMLFALLLGIAVHFLMEYDKCSPGIEYSSKAILRIGVALLGLRITVDQIAGLGFETIALVVAGVLLTICLGALLGRVTGCGTSFGVLSGGSVAICGASAAMALSAVLPPTKTHERNTIFTVLTVTALSTIAMVTYPILASAIGLNETEAGIFLGGTIHDVAQVVGAGYSISETTGDTATIIKLFRVALLMPIVLTIGVLFTWYTPKSSDTKARPKPPFPWFLLGFCLFVALNSYEIIPTFLKLQLTDLSRWCLVTAIAALGIKTSIKSLLDTGFRPLIMVVSETLFIGTWVLFGLYLL